MVSHSLGGSVALEMNKNSKFKSVTTYGAPVLQVGKQVSENIRFRHPFDIVSAFDNGSTPVALSSFNPLTLHSYDFYKDQGKEYSNDGEPVYLIS